VLEPATGEKDVTPERPTVSDSATEESPSQQEPADSVTREPHNQEYGRGKGATDPEVAKRRAIVKWCTDRGIRSTIVFCREFDKRKVPLPDGLIWDPFRTRNNPWTDAYNQRPINQERRKCIRVNISHDKDWNKDT
jgi:hypothetical protein